MERSGVLNIIACACVLGLVSTPVRAGEMGHFHHLHLNVSDVKQTTEFYRKNLGVVPIDYAGKVPAILLERSFLLMNRMDSSKIANHQLTGLTHGRLGDAERPADVGLAEVAGRAVLSAGRRAAAGLARTCISTASIEVIELTDARGRCASITFT